jgi:hypothetical protein
MIADRLEYLPQQWQPAIGEAVPYPTVASRGERRAPQVRKRDAKPQSADRAASTVTERRGGGGREDGFDEMLIGVTTKVS